MQITIDQLLHPIRADQRCGEDMTFSTAFHEIKKARTQDDISLDQGDWVTEPKVADWALVANQASRLLTEKTKDIRLASWLCEAWSHLHGFSGMAASLELLQGLLELFWEDIHPTVIDEDLEQRLGLIQGMINAIPMLIKHVPLSMQSQSYRLMDYENLLYQQNNRLKNHDDSQDQPNLIAMEQFEQAIASCSVAFTAKIYDDFNQVGVQWSALKHSLNTLMPHDAPRYAQLDAQIQQTQQQLKKIYKIDDYTKPTAIASAAKSNALGHGAIINSSNHHLQPEPQLSELSPQTQNSHSEQLNSALKISTTASMTFHPQQSPHLHNREQALQLLQQISDYFQENEPHSPVSYMLNKTIQWSQLPLHLWLAQVLKNDQALESVSELLGTTAQAHND